MENPWMDRKPGMTLGGVGLFFQRDQTWWKPGRAWVEYAQRCQALLQSGKPVADVAVFTGEELPRRAVLPDRLVTTLPGIFGDSVVQHEKKRLANIGTPLRSMPEGVTHSANMADPENWVDPLHGYAYDSFNPDVLLQATYHNGRVEFPGGAGYKLLVLPQPNPLSPSKGIMTPAVATKIAELVKAGATIIVNDEPQQSMSLQQFPEADKQVKEIGQKIWKKQPGIKGHVIQGPYHESSFRSLGIEKDVEATDSTGKPVGGIAWTHRKGENFDIYFISNQLNEERNITISLNGAGRWPEIWNPVTGDQQKADNFYVKNGRTQIPLQFAVNGSLFIILRESTTDASVAKGKNRPNLVPVSTISQVWTVTFDSTFGGPAQPVPFEQLKDWSANADSKVRYYSGTAAYTNTFDWKNTNTNEKVWLDAGKVANLAAVYVNDKYCGVVWTAPYRVDITGALHPGKNQLRIEVTNTWANRLTGDASLPEKERITWTTATLSMKDKPLLKAGLLGPVTLNVQY
jgi:hypothetical protein